MTTTDYVPTGADSFDNDVDHANYRLNLRHPGADTGQHLRAVDAGVYPTYLAVGDPLLYAARGLDHYTGHKPVLVWDGGQYLGLHIQGNGRHHVLADAMTGKPQLLVLSRQLAASTTLGPSARCLCATTLTTGRPWPKRPPP